MQAKLTLRLDKQLIERAKSMAHDQNKSLSQLVEDYFRLLTAHTNARQSAVEDLPPITRSLVGILQGKEVDEDEYRAYLETKHC